MANYKNKNNQLQLLEQQDVISAYVIMADNKNNILESHKKVVRR